MYCVVCNLLYFYSTTVCNFRYNMHTMAKPENPLGGVGGGGGGGNVEAWTYSVPAPPIRQ